MIGGFGATTYLQVVTKDGVCRGEVGLEVAFELKASSEVAFQVRNLVRLFRQTQLDVLDGPLSIWMVKSTCVEDLNLISSMTVTT